MSKNRFHTLKIALLTFGLLSASTFGVMQVGAGYEIQKGDTLYSIAKKHYTTGEQLKQVNQLTSNLIYAGDTLIIPTTVTVKKGDTLYRIAKDYHTSVAQLKRVNQLTSNLIYPGDKLIIPSTVVTVKKGDTLYRFSKIYGLSVDELKSINGLKSNTIYVGQKLIVSKDETKKTSFKGYDPSKVKVDVSIKKDFTFDAEEPRKFILQYKKDSSYFARIEILDANAKLSEIKENSMALLQGNKISEIKNSQYSIYKDAKFFLHGSNNQTQTNIVVKKIDGKLIRYTLHYQNKEESESIVPQMNAILETTKIN